MNEENPLSVIHQGGVADVHEGRPVRVLGVDLGTTNSTVSECVWDVEGAPPVRVKCLEVVQPTLEGEYTHLLLSSLYTNLARLQRLGKQPSRVREWRRRANSEERHNRDWSEHVKTLPFTAKSAQGCSG